MERIQLKRAFIRGFDGPFFPPQVEVLNEAWQNLNDVSEVLGTARWALEKAAQSIPGFKLCLEIDAKEGKKFITRWNDALFFDVGAAGKRGEVVIAFHWPDQVGGASEEEIEIPHAGIAIYKLAEGNEVKRRIVKISVAIYTKGSVIPEEIEAISERLALRLFLTWKIRMIPYIQKSLGLPF